MNHWIPIAAAVTLSLSPLLAQSTKDPALDTHTPSLREVIAELEASQAQATADASNSAAQDSAAQDPDSNEGNPFTKQDPRQQPGQADALGRWVQGGDTVFTYESDQVIPIDAFGQWFQDGEKLENPFLWKDANGDPITFGWVNPDGNEAMKTFWHYDAATNPFDNLNTFYQRGSLGVSVSSSSDGALSVKVNGKEVDPSQLRRNGDEVEVLGENGKVIFEFKHKAGGAVEIPQGATGYFTFDDPAKNSAAERPLIGINMEAVSEPLAYHLNIPEGSGILITGVIDGFSAKRAGVKKYDIVTGIGGVKGDVTMQSLRDAVAANAGGSIRLAVLRQGQRMVIDVPVEMRKSTSATTAPPGGTIRWGDPHRVDPRLDTDVLRWRPLIASDGRLVIDPQVVTPDRKAPATLQRLEERLERLEKMIERLDKKF